MGYHFRNQAIEFDPMGTKLVPASKKDQFYFGRQWTAPTGYRDG